MTVGKDTKPRISKAEQSRRTRRRIVAAATALFLRDGFQTTTVVAIAKEAGVAVQTLYLSFGNKTAILGAAWDVALAGDDEAVGLIDRVEFPIIEAPDGPAALTRFLQDTSRFIRRAGPLYAVFQAAAGDPEIADLLRTNQHARHDNFATVAEVLSGKSGFASGLSVEDATGILYAVQSEESWLLLVAEHGWTGERWEEWVLDTLLAQLYPGSTHVRGRTD